MALYPAARMLGWAGAVHHRSPSTGGVAVTAPGAVGNTVPHYAPTRFHARPPTGFAPGLSPQPSAPGLLRSHHHGHMPPPAHPSAFHPGRPGPSIGPTWVPMHPPGRPVPQRPVAPPTLLELPTIRVSHRRMRTDLNALCNDPELRARLAADPSYRRTADHVANRLAGMGVAPAGDDGSYLQWFDYDGWGSGVRHTSCNVVGMVPGSTKPDEVVIVIGHLDNLNATARRRHGLQDYRGANDNAGAVVVGLEAAHQLTQTLGQPKRSVLFFFPSAEEDGLKGTEYFVRHARSLGVDLTKVVGVINLEMIGGGPGDQVNLYGAYSDQEADVRGNPVLAIMREVAARTGTPVGSGPRNDGGRRWFGRSDHYPFHMLNRPTTMLHGGTDLLYHTDQDNTDNFNMRKAAHSAVLTTHTMWQLANNLTIRPAGPLPRVRSVNPGYSGYVGPATFSEHSRTAWGLPERNAA